MKQNCAGRWFVLFRCSNCQTEATLRIVPVRFGLICQFAVIWLPRLCRVTIRIGSEGSQESEAPKLIYIIGHLKGMLKFYQ